MQLTPGVERVLRAVAAAHRATGVPISTHTDAGTQRGLDQQRIFRAEGVDLSRVVIGHCGDSTDLRYLSALMDAGSYIGMDRFGLEGVVTTADRVATVAALVRQGYAERIVLSHDTSCFTHTYDPDTRRRNLPNWRYTYLLESVIPALVDHGVDEADVRRMLVDNPRRILSSLGGY